MYCRMCVDVHGLTPTKLNQPSEAEFLVSHCYEGDLRHKHDENQGFIQPMCASCVERIKKNPDLFIFSVKIFLCSRLLKIVISILLKIA